jgi:uncharacterized protein with PQ loop repeat
MTREQFAKKVHWSRIVWVAGLVNVVAMLPQTYQLLKTHETSGLSVTMLLIYFGVQVSFSLNGFFARDRMMTWCLGLSAIITALNIIRFYSFR